MIVFNSTNKILTTSSSNACTCLSEFFFQYIFFSKTKWNFWFIWELRRGFISHKFVMNTSNTNALPGNLWLKGSPKFKFDRFKWRKWNERKRKKKKIEKDGKLISKARFDKKKDFYQILTNIFSCERRWSHYVFILNLSTYKLFANNVSIGKDIFFEGNERNNMKTYLQLICKEKYIFIKYMIDRLILGKWKNSKWQAINKWLFFREEKKWYRRI